ncbi:MAG: bifunctional DNA primase/polymerase [Nitrosopumilus sp.]|nr:bifunctional DNA primase/polymerase [Nitrosopumilus sp.]
MGLEWVEKYRNEHGFSLIPNNPKTKIPAFKKGEYKQYFDKVCHEEIKADYNVGVMLGKPSNNLVAFDDDTGKETFLEVCPEYRDITFTTKSGKKGGAIFFRLMDLPKFNYASIKKDGKQIEFFSRNRQIILPPSIHPDTGNQYEIKNDHQVLDITKEQFVEIFTKFKEAGWAISYSNDEKPRQLGVKNKNAIMREGENRSLFLLKQIDSWKIKNPELDEQMLYDLANRWNQLHCDPPYPDEKIQSLVRQGYEFGTSKIIENDQQEAVDEFERIEREKLETPLQQITRYVNTVIKEDPKLADQLIRVGLSTYTDNPINIALLAPSSDGKTYATVKVTDLFPKEDVIAVGRMSPTALIHQHGDLIDKNGNSIKEKLDEINNQIANTQEKSEKSSLKEQRKNILSGARNCIDLKHKIILFLDNPNSATYEMLKPIMSHDKNEIIYKTTKGNGSLDVKESVIRNWPVFIFCSAKNEARNDVWQEIKTRVLMTSPNSSVKKYKEAIRYNMLKRGLPSWASSVYHNDEDEKWAKFYIADYKKKLNKLFHDGNPIVNVFYSKLTEIFPSSQGDHMRDSDRLLSFIELETVLNADYRPVYELEFDDKVNSAIITTINDIDKACKVLGDIGDLPPEKMKFYNDVFCPLVEKKSLISSGILGEIGLTSSELAEEYTTVTGKTTNSKKILENYLQPLVDAGVLDSFPDGDKRNQNKYCKVSAITTQNISNLKSKIVEDSKSLESGVRSCLDLLAMSSTKDEKYNTKIQYNNSTITIEELIQVISDNSSKSKET